MKQLHRINNQILDNMRTRGKYKYTQVHEL